MQEVELELAELTTQYEEKLGFWRFRKRRQLRGQIDALGSKREVAFAQFERRKLNWEKKATERAPVIENLSVEGKRKINLALIAIAQEMFIHFAKSRIAELAREASVRQVVDVNYGDIKKCRELNTFIENRVQSLPVGDELLVKVKLRAKYLQSEASYRNANETVPSAESFAIIPEEISADGQAVGNKPLATNILAEEYWEIYSVLLN